MRIVLASGSPRRRELMGLLGREFEVIAPDIDESVIGDESARAYVGRLAVEKATAVAVVVGADDVLVVAADTTVDLDGVIVGKPADPSDACAMLRSLAGRTHETHTGVCVRRGAAVASDVVTTAVEFAPMTDAEIAWYVATGEPLDKAGAYGMQRIGSCFVARIHGNPQNVIGLPMATVLKLAAELGVNLLA